MLSWNQYLKLEASTMPWEVPGWEAKAAAKLDKSEPGWDKDLGKDRDDTDDPDDRHDDAKASAQSLARSQKSDEEDYLRFKKQLRGEYTPISDERKSFLSRYKKWTFKKTIEGAPSKGQAAIRAKEIMFSPEGVGSFFNLENQFKILSSVAHPVDGGWEVSIQFMAAPAKGEREDGTMDYPTKEDLARAGFTPAKTVEKEQKLPFEVMTVVKDPMKGGKPLDEKAALVAAASKVAPMAKELFNDITPNWDRCTATFNNSNNHWEITIDIEAVPLKSLEEIEKAGFIGV